MAEAPNVRVQIGIRILPKLKRAAEDAARAERRSLSSWVEGLIEDRLAATPRPTQPARKRQGA